MKSTVWYVAVPVAALVLGIGIYLGMAIEDLRRDSAERRAALEVLKDKVADWGFRLEQVEKNQREAKPCTCSAPDFDISALKARVKALEDAAPKPKPPGAVGSAPVQPAPAPPYVKVPVRPGYHR